MADSMLKRHPVSLMRWRYEDGFLVKAIEQVGLRTGEARYWQAVVDYVDRFVKPDGSIGTYCLADYNLDQVNPGKLLFPVYRANGAERYRQAICLLREQLRLQPRTHAGGFWHKLIYPHQMWLDGIYMGSPFYAQYAATFDEPAAFDDVVHQIITIEQHTRDPKTGLLYHAWDESRQQRWANPSTGWSPHFWCRAIGWYVMALVDVLDTLPASHPQAATIIAILERTLAALLAVQDPATGLWYQVLDQGDRPGNYLEASGACMFVYAMAKGVRKGHLPPHWLDVARRSYQQIVERFIQVDALGETNLHWTCGMAGLGGDPYRDGSYEYYVTERVVTNDPKGSAAFILAAVEMEIGNLGDR
ncbi:MAG: glycoside hydrolase family 88 protein [Chloroflexi bacterium]|nr:glycoside hydrolase family 88 protein [Chloroflexota bacterium]